MFLTDYFRCSSFEEPIFVVQKDIIDESGSGTYQGLGYTVEIEKYNHEVYGKGIDHSYYYEGYFVYKAEDL